MDKNIYLKNIAGKLEFMRGHWRIAAVLLFAVFLFYIAMLSINIMADMNIYPGAEEVDKKFLIVKIRKDIISNIDRFSLFGKDHLAGYLENPVKRNPFSSYEANYPEISPGQGATPFVSAD
jgi:hypothetical protein